MPEPLDVNWDESLDPATVPPTGVTKKLFRQWRAPRFGAGNPERMDNPVWEWLIRSHLTAYAATQQMGGPSALKAGAGWCFHRFGQSETRLPDGRRILVGGEHEDFYDPDFCIYNDVVVLHPDRRIEILGYPREVFPPTDFHTATLAGDALFIIGNCGYAEDRPKGATPVFRLDLRTFAISAFPTSGQGPSGLNNHTAELDPDGCSITVRGGRGEAGRNINDWRLRLDTGCWERLTDRVWQVWSIGRNDGEMLQLMQIRPQLMMRELSQYEGAKESLAQFEKFQADFGIPSLEEELGGPIDTDAVAQLYQPPVEHQPLPDPGNPMLRKIRVGQTLVSFEEGPQTIEVVVEEGLPQKVINTIVRDVAAKLTRVEHAPCRAARRKSA